jgi:3-hydroxyisobutyrate dehydrogenase-like beta-hydroxyacid dehydrogenase
MTVFMAGEKDLAEEMRPMMEDIYCNVLYTGKIGTALIPKVVFSFSKIQFRNFLMGVVIEYI